VMHRIGSMEMEYLTRNVGNDRVSLFKEYVTQKRDGQGEVVHPICPLYDRDRGGCSAYSYRPMSCRLFGHYFLEGTEAPEECLYKERGKKIKAARYFDEIPFARDLRELNWEYLSRRPYTTKTMKEENRYAEKIGLESLVEDIDLVDVVDRALHLELKGELEQAYQLFREHEREQGASPFFYFYFGNLCDEMEKYDEAIECFRHAISLKDDNSLFCFRLALDLVVRGEREEALGWFLKVIELNPENAIALGYLGYLHLIDAKPRDAAGYLEKSLAIDSEQPFFRFRLGLAYLGMGRGDDAEAELEQVKDFPPVAKDALHLLSEIARVKSERESA
jgi:tetratricopeptide (TPR) repeat protein